MTQRGTPAKIDVAELEKLCALQCTDVELAAWFNFDVRTIERRRKVRSFREAMDRGKPRAAFPCVGCK
jgi:hypothetical protein